MDGSRQGGSEQSGTSRIGAGLEPCPSCSRQGSGPWSHEFPGFPKQAPFAPPTGTVALPDNLFLSTQGRWSSVLLTYVCCVSATHNMLSRLGHPQQAACPRPCHARLDPPDAW